MASAAGSNFATIPPSHMKRTIVATFGLLLFWATSLQAADIKVMFPAAMRSAMTEIIPRFEKISGEKVNIEYDLSAATDGRQSGSSALTGPSVGRRLKAAHAAKRRIDRIILQQVDWP